MARERYDAVVVGAGHNGLVTASYLAKAGLRTLVLERRSRAGGPLATEEVAPGVRAPVAADRVGGLRDDVVRDLGFVRSDGVTPIAQPHLGAERRWSLEDLRRHGLTVESPNIRYAEEHGLPSGDHSHLL